MFDFKKVPLPDYSRTEDTVNSVTHAVGVPFSIFVLIMCFIKIEGRATGTEIVSILVYSISMFILYFGSAFYHGLKPGLVKQVARVLDHSNIFLLITGTLTPFYLLGLMPYSRTLAITLLSVCWGLSALGIFFTFMDQEKFKKIQMALYLILGYTAVIGMKSLYKSGDAGKQFVMLILLGGAAYTIGAILYGIGKKHRYFHAVFHIFILAGTALHFAGIYLCVL